MVRMGGCRWVLCAALLVVAPHARAAEAQCHIGQLAELPATVEGWRAVVPVQINGEDATMAIDSGAFYSLMTLSQARHSQLDLRPTPFGFTLNGTTGDTSTKLATVKEFKLANLVVPKVEFLVGGTEMGAGVSGLLGQNILGWHDVEYDLASGAVRLMRTKDCGKHQLAYWSKTEPSEIDIEPITAARFHTVGSAYLNGKKISVMFDTGAPTSVLTKSAAERAGFKVDSPESKPNGLTGGIGMRRVPSWITRFDSFKIGDEEVRNARLRVGDIELGGPDMLLGLDFFLSHRVYVANEQHRLYFTYNGGPVFDLRNFSAPATSDSAPSKVATSEPAPVDSAPAATAPGDASAPAAGLEKSADPAELSRRGMAELTRRDFTHALEDLNKACELAPNVSAYFAQRASGYWQSGQMDKVLPDLDTALQLDPKNLDALFARFIYRREHGDRAGALADLDAAAAAATKESPARLPYGRAYLSMDQLRQALVQFNDWIAVHPEDAQLFEALNDRCYTRALLNEELDQALSDCNGAISRQSKSAALYDSRGLVQLRRGEYKKAIADYGDAIALRAKSPWSLYGRGIAELRLGKNAEGQADIAAAEALQPKIREQTAKYGIAP